MDTKNIIAAISLSAAVIILYSLFFVEPPDPNKIKKDQVKKTKIVESSDAPALEQNENFSKLSRKEVLNESKRIEFENNNIVGTINTVGALLDDLTFKKYNIELGGNEKIILLNPRKVENGYLIESGFVTNNKNIDVPNSSTVWKIVSKLDKQPNVEDLIRLYESDGVTPEYLKEMKIISEIPSTFYGKLAELHQSKKQREQESFPLEGIPDTELLFYGDDPREFDAKVLKSFENFVILDRTAFYARGGGQEPDHGKIAGQEIIDITKHGNIVVHEIKGDVPKEGDTVSCTVDAKRRDGITKNHYTNALNSENIQIFTYIIIWHDTFY